MQRMGRAGMPRSTFAERLGWLLTAVPREAGSEARFSHDDVVAVLAVAVPEGGTSRISPVTAASRWLSQALAEAPRLGTRGSELGRRYVAALEDLFRLPPGYFEDGDLAAQVDARIEFVNSPGAQGVRVNGPCRVFASEMTAAEIHQVHFRLEQVLTRGRSA